MPHNQFKPLLTLWLYCIPLATSSVGLNSNITSDDIPKNDTYVGYVEEPSGRGTSSLVISCLSTLILCVWSALHLNVPVQGQSRIQAILINIRWITTGIYAPELVVFTAWRQWCSARILSKIVKNRRTCEEDVPRENPKCHSIFDWTISHSFFACTGGFAFEIDLLRHVIGPHKESEGLRPARLTLTARGVALLAKCGYLPRATKEEIMDKSKANDLAKAAVLVQASWMLTQVVGRLFGRLPVTLLEVNTVAHVLCAFAMYIFWWEKPLLPNEPIVLRDEYLAPLATFMYVSSEMSGHAATENVKSQTLIKTLFAHLSLYSKTPELETLTLHTPTRSGHESVQESSSDTGCQSVKMPQVKSFVVSSPCKDHDNEAAPGKRKLDRAPTSCLQVLHAKRQKEAGTAFFERRPRIIAVRDPAAPTSEHVLAKWRLAEQALEAHGKELYSERIALSHTIVQEDGTTQQCIHLKPEQLVATHIQNWPWDDLLRNVNGLVVGMVLWLANLCYGGIHLAAWNDHFPTVIEEWCWRASACYVGFCGGLWIILNFAVAMYPRLNEFWERWMDGEKKWWQSFGLGMIVFICGFSLVLARVFIVIEAFLSMRELPARAYETPVWSDIFPHF